MTFQASQLTFPNNKPCPNQNQLKKENQQNDHSNIYHANIRTINPMSHIAIHYPFSYCRQSLNLMYS